MYYKRFKFHHIILVLANEFSQASKSNKIAGITDATFIRLIPTNKKNNWLQISTNAHLLGKPE